MIASVLTSSLSKICVSPILCGRTETLEGITKTVNLDLLKLTLVFKGYLLEEKAMSKRQDNKNRAIKVTKKPTNNIIIKPIYQIFV